MRVLAPLKLLINVLEQNHMLDKDNDEQVGAFSSIAVCLMQVGDPNPNPNSNPNPTPILTPALALTQTGLDRLRAAWNEHYVKPKRGRAGGRPSVRAQQRPRRARHCGPSRLALTHIQHFN